MKLTVQRTTFLETCTIGKLLIDGQDFGIYTLEDKYREVAGQPASSWKVQNETAIPKGTYDLILQFSPHFQELTPLLMNVEDYTFVRIHPGNTDVDTDGCILVGLEWSLTKGDFIGRSREAFDLLMGKLRGVQPLSIEVC